MGCRGPAWIRQYSTAGTVLHQINTSFCLPQSVGADHHGDVFVTEGVCQRVQEFNSEGKLVRQFFDRRRRARGGLGDRDRRWP